MAKYNEVLNEYADISEALCDWFQSQEIAPSRAVGVMAYLIGVMVATAAKDKEGLEQSLIKAGRLAAIAGAEALLSRED